MYTDTVKPSKCNKFISFYHFLMAFMIKLQIFPNFRVLYKLCFLTEFIESQCNQNFKKPPLCLKGCLVVRLIITLFRQLLADKAPSLFYVAIRIFVITNLW